MKRKPAASNRNIFSQIKNPNSVKILIFVNQRVGLKDYSFISGCYNLIRLDLSQNSISHLPKELAFSKLERLRVLLLHHNELVRLSDITTVVESRTIEYLTLFGNPVMQESSRTRHFVINRMLSLRLFNEHVVVEQERSSECLPNSICASCSPDTYLKYPVVDMSSVAGTNEYMVRTQIEKKIYNVRWLKCNPLIRLQRWIKGILRRRNQQRVQQTRALKQNNSAQKKALITEPIAEAAQSQQVVLLAVQEVNHEQSRQLQAENKESEMNRKSSLVISLFLVNFTFFRCTVHSLGIERSLIISRFLLEDLRSKKPGLLSEMIIAKVPEYRFVRIDPYVNPSRKLLRYIVSGNISSVVVRQPKRINRRRIIRCQALPYIQKKNGRLTESELRRVGECSRLLAHLEQSYEDNAVSVNGPFEKLLLLIRYVLLQRAKNETPANYGVYVPTLLKRVASAVRIQSYWRGYQTRKRAPLVAYLTKWRAANKIQMWIRNLPFHHRLRFLKYMREDLIRCNGRRLVLPDSLYIHINTMRERKFLRLPYQNEQIVSDGLNVKLRISQGDIRSLLPSYLDDLVGRKQLVSENREDEHQGNIYNILHTNSSVSRLIGRTKETLIMFEFASELVLKQRKLLLALKTYNFKHHFYLKCFTDFNQQSLLSDYADAALKVCNVDLRGYSSWVEKSQASKQAFSPETHGVFLGSCSVTSRREMNVQTVNLKFILGRKIHQARYDCHWTADGQQKVDSRLASIVSARSSAKYTKHVIADPMLSPRQPSISVLSNNASATIPSEPAHEGHLLAFQKFLAGSVSISTINQPDTRRLLYPKATGRYTSMEQSVSGSKSQWKSIEATEVDEAQLMEHKRQRIARSKETKHTLRTLRLSKREQELKQIRQAQANEELMLSKQLLERRQQQQQNASRLHDYIYEKIHREQPSSGAFEMNFVKKGNNAIRYEFANKIRSAQSKWEKPKNVIQSLHPTRAHTTKVSSSIKLARERLINRMPELQETEHISEEPIDFRRKKAEESVIEYSKLESEEADHAGNRQPIEKHDKRRNKRQMVHSVFPEEFYPLRQDQEESILVFPRISK